MRRLAVAITFQLLFSYFYRPFDSYSFHRYNSNDPILLELTD